MQSRECAIVLRRTVVLIHLNTPHWTAVWQLKKILFGLRTHVKGIHVRTMGSVCSCQEQSILVTVVSAKVQDFSVQDVKRNVPRTSEKQ